MYQDDKLSEKSTNKLLRTTGVITGMLFVLIGLLALYTGHIISAPSPLVLFITGAYFIFYGITGYGSIVGYIRRTGSANET